MVLYRLEPIYPYRHTDIFGELVLTYVREWFVCTATLCILGTGCSAATLAVLPPTGLLYQAGHTQGGYGQVRIAGVRLQEFIHKL